MYGKMYSTKSFSMKPPYYLYLMHSKVVELEELYLGAEWHIQIYQEKLRIHYFTFL